MACNQNRWNARAAITVTTPELKKQRARTESIAQAENDIYVSEWSEWMSVCVSISLSIWVCLFAETRRFLQFHFITVTILVSLDYAVRSFRPLDILHLNECYCYKCVMNSGCSLNASTWKKAIPKLRIIITFNIHPFGFFFSCVIQKKICTT